VIGETNSAIKPMMSVTHVATTGQNIRATAPLTASRGKTPSTKFRRLQTAKCVNAPAPITTMIAGNMELSNDHRNWSMLPVATVANIDNCTIPNTTNTHLKLCKQTANTRANNNVEATCKRTESR
jgi:hypothetical protein